MAHIIHDQSMVRSYKKNNNNKKSTVRKHLSKELKIKSTVK